MSIKEGHLLAYRASVVAKHLFRCWLRTAIPMYGSLAATAKVLGCDESEIETLLKEEPLPDCGGQVVIVLQGSELKGLTKKRVELQIEARIVTALAHLLQEAIKRGSVPYRELEVFTGIEEKRIKRALDNYKKIGGVRG